MLKELLEMKASQKEIMAYLENAHAYDIVQMLDTLTESQQEEIFGYLEPERLAEILSYLHPEEAAEVFTTFSLEEQKEVVEELDPDDAADIINELADDDRKDLIEVLDKDEEVLSLIGYEEETAGAYMTNDIIIVPEADDVKLATKKVIKRAADVDSIQTIFVADENGLYVGQVTLKSLIKAKSPLTVKDIIETEPTVLVTDHVDNLVKHMKHYGGYDIGVVNENGLLVGAITMDDILDIYQEETQEDIEKLAALPETDFTENLFKSAMHRLPWLVILLLLSIPIALATTGFEEILASVVILALFQPLILDSGGDVASQTLAVTLISMTTKESSSIKNGIKEIISGTISGAVMGIMAFFATVIFAGILGVSHQWQVASVVGGALFITVMIAPFLGFFIPTFLKSIKVDPSVASGPFITTLIDILSVFIYFGLATLILGGLYHG